MTTCSIEGCEGSTKGSGRGWCSKHYQRWKAHGDPLVMVQPKDPATKWAWIDAALVSDTDDCIDWPWGRHVFGYGVILGRQRVHVLVCEATHGPRPPKLVAAHRCGRPQCCNPRHLRWATKAEDSADRRDHGTHLEGERTPAARLTEGEVREIRSLHAAGATRQELADMFNVSYTCIRFIITGRTWKSVA